MSLSPPRARSAGGPGKNMFFDRAPVADGQKTHFSGPQRRPGVFLGGDRVPPEKIAHFGPFWFIFATFGDFHEK